ncbi:MAG: transcription elongation factor GreA [Bacilli bacterium]|nr:transcription elongation factor GreA [Bacilli bacterium]
MSKKECLLTAEGFLKLESELNELKTVKRPQVIEAIKDARAQGDLSENADYDAARNDQAELEARIKELEYMIDHAKIIEGPEKGVVGVGSTITIEYVGDDEQEEYRIVGSLEANPFENRISNESPIGKAVLNKKVGDIVNVESPNGSYEVKILAIN